MTISSFLCAKNGCNHNKLLILFTATLVVAIATILSTADGQKLRQNLSNKFDRRHHHHEQSEKVATNRRSIKNTNHKEQPNDNQTSGATISASFSDLTLRAFIRTNNMRAYHMDLHSYRQGSEFSGDPAFVDSASLEHKARCARHLMEYNRLLGSFKESNPMQETVPSEAMKLADIFGRPEAGILHGNQFWLGSYSECFNFKLPLSSAVSAGRDDNDVESATATATAAAASSSSSHINSQYCLGISQFPNWNPQHTKTSIKVGLCLPETCTNSMLNNDAELFRIVEQMMKFQFGSDLPFKRINLKQIYCLPHETSEVRHFSLSAKLLLALIGSFAVFCLIATIFDYIDGKMPANLKSTERNKRRVLIEAFSLSRNYKKLVTISNESDDNSAPPPPLVESSDGNEDFFDRKTFFDVISGLKCIGLMWIIFAHTFLVSPITDQNMINLDRLTKTYFANVLLTAHLMVDTFFALSGLLASYFIFKGGINKLRTRDWIVATIHRYYRLTPVYLLCYWFTKSLGSQFGSGPFWDYGTAAVSPRLNCANESWLVALLHMSDFKSPKEHCIPFAWFIANGIKFWMVTPLFLIAIGKSMKRGYTLTGAVILANILLVMKLAYTSNVDMKSVVEFRPESADNMLNNMGEVYTRPYSRIAPYLIGLMAGHLIYLIDTKQVQVNLSKNVKILIWTWFTLTVILLTFVIKIASGIKLHDEVLPYVFAASSALLRPLWALCTCWFVLALAHGQAKWVARFLAADCWRILARLSFCAYLAQGEVIAQLFLGRSEDSTFVYSDMFTRSIIVIIYTILVSVVIVVFIEYPLIGIEELLLPRKKKQTQTVANGTVVQNDVNLPKQLPNNKQVGVDNGAQKISSNGDVKLKSA